MEFYTGPEDSNGCKNWLGGRNGSGYPTISTGKSGSSSIAHRVAYELAGNVLDHRPIHHKCANKLCVNADHLVAVEPHENTAEMFDRNYLLSRIEQLEKALSEVDPSNTAIQSK